jgi:putative transposase
MPVMASPRRLQIAGLTQHVINRGADRCDIFRAEKDYACFLALLRDAALRYQMDVHSYTLMTNHFHLVGTPRVPTGISMTMQVAQGRYVKYFNRRYSRTGTLFEGPFKSMFIDSEKYWFACMRYVELNPVRAGMVSDPADYRWSSYSANARGLEDDLIVPHPLYVALGKSAAHRQHGWSEICREALPSELLFEIRDVVRRGGVLGEAPRKPKTPKTPT